MIDNVTIHIANLVKQKCRIKLLADCRHAGVIVNDRTIPQGNKCFSLRNIIKQLNERMHDYQKGNHSETLLHFYIGDTGQHTPLYTAFSTDHGNL